MKQNAFAFMVVVALLATPAVLAHTPEHLPGGFHSPDLRLNDRWTLNVNSTEETLFYHCHYHTFMEGRIFVKAGAPARPIVTMQSYVLQPVDIHVALGGAVEWINRDNDTHNVVQSKPFVYTPPNGGSSPGPPMGALIVAAVAAVVFASRRR